MARFRADGSKVEVSGGDARRFEATQDHRSAHLGDRAVVLNDVVTSVIEAVRGGMRTGYSLTADDEATCNARAALRPSMLGAVTIRA